MPIIKKGDKVESDMDDLYEEESSSEPMSDDSSESEEASTEPATELISSKLIMGKSVKPGDKVVLEVVKTYGDEVEVKYASEGKKPSMTEDEELEALAE